MYFKGNVANIDANSEPKVLIVPLNSENCRYINLKYEVHQILRFLKKNFNHSE